MLLESHEADSFKAEKFRAVSTELNTVQRVRRLVFLDGFYFSARNVR